MLSQTLQRFLHTLTVLYFVLGGILFFAPTHASANFAWNVSPFVAMTIGGWCLGNAWLALIVARRQTWSAGIGSIVYLAVFGVLQCAVLVAFWARVRLDTPLACLYLVTIILTAVIALVALVEWIRTRPQIEILGPRFGRFAALLIIAFTLFVGFLGIYGLTVREGGRGLHGGIFPEPLSLFTVRSFGSFYLALAISSAVAYLTRGLGNLLCQGYAQYGLIVFITLAAAVFWERFDFANRPLQIMYPGIYLLVAIFVGGYLLRFGTGPGPKRAALSPSAESQPS